MWRARINWTVIGGPLTGSVEATSEPLEHLRPAGEDPEDNPERDNAVSKALQLLCEQFQLVLAMGSGSIDVSSFDLEVTEE